MVEIVTPVNRLAAAPGIRVRLAQSYGNKRADRFVACAYNTLVNGRKVKLACLYDRCDANTLTEVQDNGSLTPSYEMSPVHSVTLDDSVDNMVEARRAIFRYLDETYPDWEKCQWKVADADKSGYVNTRNVQMVDYLTMSQKCSPFGTAPLLQVLRGYGDWRALFSVVDEPSFLPPEEVEKLADMLTDQYDDSALRRHRFAACCSLAKRKSQDGFLLVLFDRNSVEHLVQFTTGAHVRYCVSDISRVWLPIDASVAEIRRAALAEASRLAGTEVTDCDFLSIDESQTMYACSHYRLPVL